MCPSVPTVSESFPAWRGAPPVPGSVAWFAPADWRDSGTLTRVLGLFEDELEARWLRHPEEITVIGAAVVKDLYGMDSPSTTAVSVQLDFLRFFVAVKAVEYCQMHGRPR